MTSPAISHVRKPVLMGFVAELWRYPIKSMGGERCRELRLNSAGIEGDRQLAFESADAPVGRPFLRSAQRAAMLRASARLSADARTLVHIPHFSSCQDPHARDPLLLDAHGQDTPSALSTSLEIPEAKLSLVRSQRPMTDVRPVALHSITTAAVLSQELTAERLPGLTKPFDARRLRSNIVLDIDLDRLAAGLKIARDALPPFPEDSLVGWTIQIGEQARMKLLERIPRCRIVSLDPEPPGTAPSQDSEILRHLAGLHQGRAGIYGRPLLSGPVQEGDPLLLLA